MGTSFSGIILQIPTLWDNLSQEKLISVSSLTPGQESLSISNWNTSNITLIGHSRGGGIVTIKASEDKRITKLITWASVSDFKARFADEKARAYWKSQGVIHVENSRTKQQLPHYYQFYEDFIENEERFTIKTSAEKIEIPFLIIHGTNDPTVDLKEAKALHTWNPNSKLLVIEEADHVFGGKHPWEEKKLPQHMKQVVEASLKFIKN